MKRFLDGRLNSDPWSYSFLDVGFLDSLPACFLTIFKIINGNFSTDLNKFITDYLKKLPFSFLDFSTYFFNLKYFVDIKYLKSLHFESQFQSVNQID